MLIYFAWMNAKQADAVELDFIAGGLDVASSAFDPLRALYAESLPISEASVRTFNNVAEFENFLKNPDKVRDKRNVKAPGGGAAAEPAAAAGAATSNPVAAPKHRREVKNVLTRMENMQGPLSFLRKCVVQRTRVRVTTRNYRSVRGVCRGYIVAFDKHWNLAMADVDEEFSNPLHDTERRQESAAIAQIKKNRRRKLKTMAAAVLNPDEPEASGRLLLSSYPSGGSEKPNDVVPGLPSDELPDVACTDASVAAIARSLAGFVIRESKRTMPKTLCRHINQLFIRGDNVVSVSFLGQ